MAPSFGKAKEVCFELADGIHGNMQVDIFPLAVGWAAVEDYTTDGGATLGALGADPEERPPHCLFGQHLEYRSHSWYAPVTEAAEAVQR